MRNAVMNLSFELQIFYGETYSKGILIIIKIVKNYIVNWNI